MPKVIKTLLSVLSLLLAGCAQTGPIAEDTRAHDARNDFVPDAATFEFAAMADSATPTDRWSGVLGGAGYRIEVPSANWNGKLVMYAHGYVGTGKNLVVQDPPIRRYLVDNGFAWAASSYSKNYYDVRAGVEDTNALALAFNAIAERNGRPLARPSKTYIFGRSMGGHVAAAAVEAETLATANHKMRYDGAVPTCGVLGDEQLWAYFGGYQLAAQQLAGLPAAALPVKNWEQLSTHVRTTLFNSTTSFAAPTPQGLLLKNMVMNLTGGERPLFEQGFANEGLQKVVWGAFGDDGTLRGVLNANVVDTRGVRYTFDAPEAVVAAFNTSIAKSTPAPDANRLRRDGLRWIPKVHADFSVPVLTIHTLGDMYVPFGLEQSYLARATAKGHANLLVQRAIRAPGHCDFTVAEQARAFADLARWVEQGVKPAGDDVATASTVANPAYGCTFTNNTLGADDAPAVKAMRAPGKLPACPAPQ
ncbi:MAG: alpha/beta hydrolase [Pseudomonadota bacterium]